MSVEDMEEVELDLVDTGPGFGWTSPDKLTNKIRKTSSLVVGKKTVYMTK